MWTPVDLGEGTWVMAPRVWTATGGAVHEIVSAPSASGGTIVCTAAANEGQALDTSGPYAAARPSLRTSNANGRLFSATGGVTGNQHWHRISIVRGHALPAVIATGFSYGAPNAAENHSLGIRSSGEYTSFNDTGSLDIPFTQAPALDPATWGYILEEQFDGTNLSTWVNGELIVSVPHTFAITDASLGFQRWNTGFPLADISFDAAASIPGRVATRAEVEAYIRWELVDLGSTGALIAFYGDSYTAGGAAGTTPLHYLHREVRARQSGVHVLYPINKGVSGKRTDEIAALFLAATNPLTHVHYWGGVNDIIGLSPGGSASTGVAADDAALMYQQVLLVRAHAQARGIKLVVSTVPQWIDCVNDPYRDAVRVAYNALVMGGSGYTKSDVSAAMGPFDAAKFGPDGTHPIDATYINIISGVVYAAVIAA